MGNTIEKIPKHLHKYIVEQHYERYTSEDQEVWRFIMRQLKSYLSKNAHEAYLNGLALTGITTNEIPRISIMDEKLKVFGWRAVAVSGFIPPAAFMEFQAHGILPIACDMRTVEHILYTPAPDIVHEAAGHAPILIDPEFSQYLKNYAEVASKAIISSEDLNLYEAIRNLSDIKEAPKSTKDEIKKYEIQLNEATANMTFVSEAQLLGRMNWWTAEYGLIGNLEAPKIFGAGLLSSIGESRNALSKPKLIPLTIDCLDYTYDITEPQPQLFVAKDFHNLNTVLNELSEQLAFKVGGLKGLKKAQQAQTVCTITININDIISYSGILVEYKFEDQLTYLKFKGPVQIAKHANQFVLEESEFFEITFKEPILKFTVHGGPANSALYPDSIDFVAARVPEKQRSIYDIQKFKAYEEIRLLRSYFSQETFLKLKKQYLEEFESEWLMGLTLLEIASARPDQLASVNELMNFFSKYQIQTGDEKYCLDLGLTLLKTEGLLK